MRLALLAVAAAACSGTQAAVVADDTGAVDAEVPSTAAPTVPSSAAPPSATKEPTTTTEPTTATHLSADEPTTSDSTSTQPVEEPPTTKVADDDELAESSPGGFVTPEPGASAGAAGRASATTDRLDFLVRCLTGSGSDLHPSVVVRRQAGDPLSEWTEPASWQYRFDGRDEAVPVGEGRMSDAEIKAFIDALALTDATQMHIDTYDADGTHELTAALSLADKHLPIAVIHDCESA